MNILVSITGISLLSVLLVLSSCAVEEKAPARPMVEAKAAPPAKPPEVKAKPLKASGDVGLLDTEKNYMILVTKEGKLITVDFNEKTKVTKYVPQKAKMSEIGLGTAGTITYKSKIVELESVEFKVKPKKGE